MSNPPPDQQIAPRGTRNQHLGQLCAGETGTSLLPPRGQATADDGRNRSTAGGYDVFAAGQARAAAYQAAAGAGSGDAGDKDEEGSYSDSSGDVPVERTETLELSPATRKLLSPSSLAQVDSIYAPGQRRTTAKRNSEDEHDGDERYAPLALLHALEGQALNTASGASMADSEERTMYSTVQDLAREEVNCLSMKQLYVLGKDPEPAHRLANAQFLHKELPVRLSQRAVELMNLPHGLSDIPGVQQVYNCYARYAWELFCAPLPSTPCEEYEYSCLLSSVLVDGQSIPRALSIGLQDFHNRLPVEDGGRGGFGACDAERRRTEMDPSIRNDVQEAISRFYTGRIGVRFLIEHHVSTLPPVNHRPGWSGIIKSAVSPSLEAKHTAAAVRSLCTRHLGAAPEIRIFGKDDATFTYIPSHLEVMLSEQLKNACRAVTERHHPAYSSMTALAGPMATWGEKECSSVMKQALAAQGWPDGGPRMPPIKVTVAMGKFDVTLKIADEGGGASRSEMAKLWTYYYTTANKFLVGSPPPPETRSNRQNAGGAASASGQGRVAAEHPLPPLAGFGLGLPLSRVYARYFGGDVLLKSMEGFGMDSYLHLNRLGHNCEELPPLARHKCV